MKSGGGKRKGGAFEREIARELSKWWTHGEREDVFYRSASSGGRATVRTKVGKKSFGQYGDISANDPIGQPLLDLCTIECKTGYPGQSMLDIVDGKAGRKSVYGKFVLQSLDECKQANVPYWLLISRRHSKIKMIYMPIALRKELAQKMHPDIWRRIRTITIKDLPTYREDMRIYGFALSAFFEFITPEQFMELAKQRRK